MAEPREPTFAPDDVRARLAAELPGWSLRDGRIRRRYATDGWPTSLLLTNQIGFLAEAADHHPDLEVRWGEVVVALRTHSAGGITGKDLELARRIEEAALWRPGAGSALRGTPRAWVRAADGPEGR